MSLIVFVLSSCGHIVSVTKMTKLEPVKLAVAGIAAYAYYVLKCNSDVFLLVDSGNVVMYY